MKTSEDRVIAAADTLGVSPSLLSRRFRDVRGVTSIQYLRGVRLQKARELLSGTDFTLQNIVEQCGYRSAFYLSRVFKASTGQSPSEYRAGSRCPVAPNLELVPWMGERCSVTSSCGMGELQPHPERGAIAGMG
ncbi:helix-turn-helix transcriptional regulator [Nonomuraea sp. NPDC048901]|uniref:helix-turn-helix transcriptional regulator n=1 Tax=Nonomuraea sp. NPDC048901 TaxID=3155627 RepID=UPI0033E927C2